MLWRLSPGVLIYAYLGPWYPEKNFQRRTMRIPFAGNRDLSIKSIERINDNNTKEETEIVEGLASRFDRWRDR